MQAQLRRDETDRVGCNQTILIVEDDPLQREFLEDNLRDQGFAAFGCESPQDVFAWACAHRPKLILLDLCFPNGCGLELCERLADHRETCQIPIIILSGSCDNDVVRKARAAGCRFFLKKPYDPNTLLLLIEQALRDADSY